MNKNNLDILKKIGNGFKTPKGYFKDVEDSVLVKISLGEFPKKEGFDIPAGYFDNVENNIFDRITVDTNSKKQSLNVPTGYFDTLEDRVFEKIQKETIQKPKVINLKSRLIKVLAPVSIAASLLLVFVLNYNNETPFSFENVAASDIEQWIEDDLISLDSYQIAEVYNDVALEDEFSDDDLEVLDYINGTDIESVLLTD